MKRLLFLFYIYISAYGLTWAQPRLTSDVQTITVGQVQWKDPIRVKYNLTNSGDSPLVLTDVTTSCACAVAYWTQSPISPQSQGTIEVEFDAEMLGSFHKSVAVYSNSTPNLVYLHFTGEVVSEITDFSNSHPYNMGNVLLDKEDLIFSETYIGEKKAIAMDIVNQTGSSYRPVVMHLPSFIEMNAEPEILQKGEKGTLTFTLNATKQLGYGLYEVPVYLSRFLGDKVGKDNEMLLSVMILPNKPLTQKQSAQLSLSTSTLNFNSHHRVAETIQITNSGKSELEIYKVQVFHPSVKIQLNKNKIQPGQQAKLKVSIDKTVKGNNGEEKVILITNDPIFPSKEIIIKQ